MARDSDHPRFHACQFLLLDSIDDDFYGLWELPVEFFQGYTGLAEPSEQDSDQCRDTLVNWLCTIFEGLLKQDLVAVFSGTKFQGEQLRLPMIEAKDAINDLKNYDYRTIPKVHIRVIATEAGKKWLSNQGYPGHEALIKEVWSELAKLRIETGTP